MMKLRSGKSAKPLISAS